MTVTICYTKISIHDSAHSVTVVCVIGWIWEEKKQVCLHSLPLCADEFSRRNKDFSKNSHSTTKRLKHSSNFESVENVQTSNVVEFELRHITSCRLSYHAYFAGPG